MNLSKYSLQISEYICVAILHIFCVGFPVVLIMCGLGLCPDMMENSPLVMRVRFAILSENILISMGAILLCLFHSYYVLYGLFLITTTYQIFGITTESGFLYAFISIIALGLVAILVMSAIINVVLNL